MIPSLAAAPARSPRNRTLECVLRPWRAWQQYGVRVGLRVQLATELAAPRPNRPQRRRRVRAYPRFHPTRVEESSRWATSRESTIVPEWPPGYLDAFEPSPWLLAASEWGVERSPWKYHMSPAYLSYGTNAHARTGAFEAGRDRSMAAFRILPLWTASFPGSARKFPVCVFYGNLGAGI